MATADRVPEAYSPIVGEFHYSRYPEREWEQEILKIKAGGIQVISTYVFWIHHEEIEGQFDWSGQRNLRRFVQLCAKHGMYVWIRVGPWAHGEVRNGGLPDWLLLKTATRENNPTYLKYVTRFYGQIGEQTKGLFWKDGGRIIGVQLENEYSARGPVMFYRCSADMQMDSGGAGLMSCRRTQTISLPRSAARRMSPRVSGPSIRISMHWMISTLF